MSDKNTVYEFSDSRLINTSVEDAYKKLMEPAEQVEHFIP